jgi:hypothetical protein
MPDLWIQVGKNAAGQDIRMPALNKISCISSVRHGVDSTAPWTIVSYDLVSKPAILEALIAAPEFDLAIIDGEQLFSPKTKRTHAMFGGSPSLMDRCGRVVGTNSDFVKMARRRLAEEAVARDLMEARRRQRDEEAVARDLMEARRRQRDEEEWARANARASKRSKF